MVRLKGWIKSEIIKMNNRLLVFSANCTSIKSFKERENNTTEELSGLRCVTAGWRKKWGTGWLTRHWRTRPGNSLLRTGRKPFSWKPEARRGEQWFVWLLGKMLLKVLSLLLNRLFFPSSILNKRIRRGTVYLTNHQSSCRKPDSEGGQLQSRFGFEPTEDLFDEDTKNMKSCREIPTCWCLC